MGAVLDLIKRIPRLKIFFCGLEFFFCYVQKLFKLKESEKWEGLEISNR